MKNFLRNVEARVLAEHEARMAQAPVAVVDAVVVLCSVCRRRIAPHNRLGTCSRARCRRLSGFDKERRGRRES